MKINAGYFMKPAYRCICAVLTAMMLFSGNVLKAEEWGDQLIEAYDLLSRGKVNEGCAIFEKLISAYPEASVLYKKYGEVLIGEKD